MKRLIFAAILFFGFASASLADTWLPGFNGDTGPNPVWAGQENHKDVYVCRAGMFPGKLIKENRKCYYTYNGVEYSNINYEVLQGTMRMRFFSADALDDASLVLGGSENDLITHICRVHLTAGILVGKLVGSVHGGICYYGWYGREYPATIFDALSNV